MKRVRGKKRHIEVKAIAITFIIFFSVERFLFILDSNNLIDEPYLWGNRSEIAYKLNKCKELFNNPKHKNKLKILIVGDSVGELAFDPFKFDNLSENKTISYNLCITQTAVRFQSFFIKKVIIPKFEPDFIIWTLTIPYDFADIENVNKYEAELLNSKIVRYYNIDFRGLNAIDFFDLLLIKISRIYKFRFSFLPEQFLLTSDLDGIIEDYENLYKRDFWRSFRVYDEDNESMHDVYIDMKFHNESEILFFNTLDFIEYHDTRFLVVVNPARNMNIVYPPVDELFNKLESEKILNLNGNESFMDNNLNHNINHLNYYGAQLYTEFIYRKICKFIHDLSI